MKYIKGPAFPTGVIIVKKDDLPALYDSGTGKIKFRGKVETEKEKKKRVENRRYGVADRRGGDCK